MIENQSPICSIRATATRKHFIILHIVIMPNILENLSVQQWQYENRNCGWHYDNQCPSLLILFYLLILESSDIDDSK